MDYDEIEYVQGGVTIDLAWILTDAVWLATLGYKAFWLTFILVVGEGPSVWIQNEGLSNHHSSFMYDSNFSGKRIIRFIIIDEYNL